MASKAIRHYFTAGVALAGVGALTYTSVPAPPEQHHSAAQSSATTADTEPVAFTDYLPILSAGVAGTVANSVDAITTRSPALWNQVVEQWPDAELTHLNYALVADTILMPVAPYVFRPLNDAVIDVLSQQFPDQAETLAQLPELSDEVVTRLLGPWLSAIGAAGAAHEQIFYATTTGELPPFFEAIADAPVTVVDGLLNGGYGDLRPLLTGEVGGQPIPAPGLLTPWGENPPPRDLKWLPDEPAAEIEDEIDVAAEVQDVVAQETSDSDDSDADDSDANDSIRDLRNGFRQSVRDFRSSVRAGLAGNEDTAQDSDEDESPSRSEDADSTDSESSDAADSD